MVVANQWMQNEERVLKNYIFIISVYENCEINTNWLTAWILDPWNKHRMLHNMSHQFLSERLIETVTKHFGDQRHWVLKGDQRSRKLQNWFHDFKLFTNLFSWMRIWGYLLENYKPAWRLVLQLDVPMDLWQGSSSQVPLSNEGFHWLEIYVWSSQGLYQLQTVCLLRINNTAWSTIKETNLSDE